MNFNFIASDNFQLTDLGNIEKFADKFPEYQLVTLNDEIELELLLKLLGFDDYKTHQVDYRNFSKYWDLSDFRLPEFDKKGFDNFYAKWIDKSKRQNNMNEYGSLIFLEGLSKKWNRLNYRLIIKEKENGT